MQSNANEISPGQTFIFIIAAQVSFGILRLASSLSEKVGHDGWISVLLAGLLTCISIYLINLSLKRFKNLSQLDINIYIFGKYFGGFLNLLVIAYLTYTTVLSLRLFSDIIMISTLRNTPGLVLTSFIIIPIVYLSWYGLKYICRYSAIEIVLICIVIPYYFLLSKYFRLSFLQPIGASGIMPIIKSTYTPFVSFLGYELMSIIYPYLKDKKKSLKFMIYGNLATTFFYFITVVILTGFFGEVMLKQLQYPIFSLARAYRAPVLERLDLFFISLWFPIMGTTVLLYYYCSYHSLKRFFNIENNKKNSKILIFCFTIAVILLSRIPKDMIQLYKMFDLLGYIGTVYIAYVISCYLFSFIKPGGKKNEAST